MLDGIEKYIGGINKGQDRSRKDAGVALFDIPMISFVMFICCIKPVCSFLPFLYLCRYRYRLLAALNSPIDPFLALSLACSPLGPRVFLPLKTLNPQFLSPSPEKKPPHETSETFPLPAFPPRHTAYIYGFADFHISYPVWDPHLKSLRFSAVNGSEISLVS